MAGNQTIVIKKIKKGGHGAHGGAWKLAYADFVTAMMAFFLLMWLLGTTEPAIRQGIADYFKDPWKPSLSGGANTGDAVSVIKGGGEDVTQSEGQVKLTNAGNKEAIAEASDADTEEARRQDISHLNEMKGRIEKMIEINPLLNQFQSQLKLDITQEGLRIQIVDQEKRPMFSTASARMEPYAAQILDQIAPVINELPNRISISGHTDAKPFPGSGQGYTNWELSSDRANAARKELIRAGLREDKMMRVVGLASSVHLENNPFDPTNRRIAIIVMNKQTEQAIKGSAKLVDVSSKGPMVKDRLAPEKATTAGRSAPTPTRPVSAQQ